ncbi:MAG: hypothetical protein R2854_15230 [Caldilineaceae bacterium]
MPLATVEIAPPQLTSGGAAVDALAGPAPLPLVLRDARSGTEVALDPEVLRAVAFSTTPLRIDRDVLRAHLTKRWRRRSTCRPGTRACASTRPPAASPSSAAASRAANWTSTRP